jgi:single-strand DNA-binding protein
MAETSITIAGNLTADVTLDKTERGISFATFTLAVTPRMRNASGQWSDAATSFHRCVVWRNQAQRVADSVHKGDRVLVVGTLRSRSYSSGGDARYITEINVDEVGPSLRCATAKPVKAKPAAELVEDDSASEEHPASEEAPAPRRRTKVAAS